MEKKHFLGISPEGWRYIGIALGILSLGLAIAWGGLILRSG